MIRILCFGDSNTYGYKPDGTGRFSERIRWTGRIQRKLGEQVQIIEEGLCGRTTIFEDAIRTGRKGLDVVGDLVEAHNPVDIFVVMLGTNDCKASNKASAELIANGIEQVVKRASEKATNKMKVLVISPIHLGKGVGEEGYDIEFNEYSEIVSIQLAAEYEKVACKNGWEFLNAAQYATPSITDREHLDATGHKKLSEAIHKKLIQMMQTESTDIKEEAIV